MSDENQDVLEDQDLVENEVEETEFFDEDFEDIQEFKSTGDESEVADPVTPKGVSNHKRPADDKEAEKSVKQGSSDEKAPHTKVGMINAMMMKMQGSSKQDVAASYKKVMEMGSAARSQDNSQAEKMVAQGSSKLKEMVVTSDDIDISEDMNAMFSQDDTLTEEFKSAASTLFETAVLTKINEVVSELAEDAEKAIEEEIEAIHEDLTSKLDSYLDYVVENWMEENRLAVESGIRTEIAEEFMGGLKTLFEESYIDIPEEKVDVLAETVEENETLEENLNSEIAKNVELKEQLAKLVSEKLINEAAKGLTDVDREKFVNLASSVDFISEGNFSEKLSMIKESYFGDKSEVLTESVIDDEPIEDAEEEKIVPAEMAQYAAAISRNIQK